MSNSKKDLTYIKKYLHDNFQMVVATYGRHPWVCTVYYSVDENLNLYFLTNPSTIHGKQIANNSKVAVAIAESPQLPSSKKKGLQIYGICEQISGKKRITHAISLWRETLGVAHPDYSYEGMMRNAISGRMYQITPKKIKFFNEELWEEGMEKLINLP